MSLIRPEVLELFPTPIFLCEIDKKSTKKISSLIYKEYKTNCDDVETWDKTKPGVTNNLFAKKILEGFCKGENVSSFQTNPDLQNRKEFSFVNDLIFNACREWESRTNIEVDTFDISLMWANIYRPNGQNPEHFHPNSFLSGIICVEDPQTTAHNGVKMALGGTTFYAPINQNFVITPRVKEEGSRYYSPTIRPEFRDGMMIIFPSWLRHAATPYHPNEIDKEKFRVTMSFNVNIRGKVGSVDQLTHSIS